MCTKAEPHVCHKVTVVYTDTHSANARLYSNLKKMGDADITLGQSYPVFIEKCVATLSTSINPITQENENCIYGPFEVDSTYYKYKMTNAPQMHLVFGLTGSYPAIIF